MFYVNRPGQFCVVGQHDRTYSTYDEAKTADEEFRESGAGLEAAFVHIKSGVYVVTAPGVHFFRHATEDDPSPVNEELPVGARVEYGETFGGRMLFEGLVEERQPFWDFHLLPDSFAHYLSSGRLWEEINPIIQTDRLHRINTLFLRA
ncbi:MAG: hypothetical protein GY871_04005 [Actinomycetales bacterium]|nr:hypothetical protein [Actinomycetales bacterium]